MALYQMSHNNNEFIVDFANSRENQGQVDETLFWFERKKNVYVDVSFIIYHYKGMSEYELILTLSALCKQKFLPKDFVVEIIILLDGVRLKDLEQLSSMIAKRHDTIIVDSNSSFIGPGLMWNAGIYISRGKKICFTWTGVYWEKDSLFHLNEIIENEGIEGVYGQVKFENSNKRSYDLNHVGEFEAYAPWIQSSHIIPLCHCLFKRRLVEKLKGFYTDITMCRIVDWEFMLRASAIESGKLMPIIGTPLFARTSLFNVHSDLKFKESIDEIIRVGLRDSVAYSHNKRITNKILNQSFSKKISATKEGKANLYKIGIITNMKESNRDQLYLLNFLEKLPNLISWRKFDESTLDVSELKNYNLIFFIRSRSNQAVKAAQFCYKKDIKTVYILDDNGFCATETNLQLENDIGVNTAFYQNFILLISTMDYVLLYNEMLWQSVREYNNQIILFPLNINLNHFKSRNKKNVQTNIRIGYVGRNSEFLAPSLKAIERIMDKYKEVNLFLKGLELPDTFKKYGKRVTISSYDVDYIKYSKELSHANCDIMVSPLGNSRYYNSKCPNSYLEITAAGAVGIYTNNELYKNIIINEHNGLIIENEEVQWFLALEQLIKDSELRKNLLFNASEEIKLRYETNVVLPKFIQLLNILFDKQSI